MGNKIEKLPSREVLSENSFFSILLTATKEKRDFIFSVNAINHVRANENSEFFSKKKKGNGESLMKFLKTHKFQ